MQEKRGRKDGWSRQALRGWRKGLARSGAVLAVFVLGTIPFWIWPLDLVISGWFYSPDTGWVHKEQETLLWELLYDFGVIPSSLVALAALLVFVGGWPIERWRRYRKISGYLILCMALGPGLLVNVCLKDGWGRPRPQAVEAFGGRYPFEPVLTMDPGSPGKSFPCGHCSMGFYLFSLALLAGWRSRAGMAAGWAASVFGILIGVARVVQGGHFASDVWWSAGVCLALSVLLYYGMSLDRRLWYEPGAERATRRLPLWLAAGLAVAVAVLIGAVLLATPYGAQEDHGLRLGEGRAFRLILVLEGDRHEIEFGEKAEELRIAVKGSGHGMPSSAVKSELFERPGYEEWEGKTVDLFLFRQRFSGWFQEVEHATSVTLPRLRTGRLELEVRSGEVRFKGGLPAAKQEWQVTFPNGNGRVRVDPQFRQALQPEGNLRLRITGGELVDEPAHRE